MPDNETYLGDGLYASFDGWQIWLRAPRPEGDHMVALEPEAFAHLVEFRRHQWALSKKDSAAFVDALENPPEPNDALKKAAVQYKEHETP